ncbi:MAG: type II toxin-antitoxin system RelE family toxin [Thermoguttaceae bacterium]
MEIVYSRQAEKWLDNHDDKTVSRIYVALKKLPHGDVVRLVGANNECRLRVGKYRIVFKINHNSVCVSKIDSRGGVYK